MYEVCMSAESRVNDRIEPTFDEHQASAPQSHHIQATSLNPAAQYQTPSPPSLDILTFDDDPQYNMTGLMIKSGMAILMAASLYGGYLFLSDAAAPGQTAQVEGQEALQADAQSNVRKIDMTKTAAIKPAKKDTDSRLIVKAIENTNATPKDSQVYIVKSGDTLSRIGKLYKTSAKSIMEINGITDARTIKPGMKLIVSNQSQ